MLVEASTAFNTEVPLYGEMDIYLNTIFIKNDNGNKEILYTSSEELDKTR